MMAVREAAVRFSRSSRCLVTVPCHPRVMKADASIPISAKAAAAIRSTTAHDSARRRRADHRR
jgi:hypothetical protein